MYNSMILSSCLLLASCSSIPMQVTWERVPKEKLMEVCQTHMAELRHYKKDIYGCSRWNKDRRECTVYTLETLARNSNAEQFVLGHETMHCFDGHYHP